MTFNHELRCLYRIFKKLELNLRSVTLIETNRDTIMDVDSNESLELHEYIA